MPGTGTGSLCHQELPFEKLVEQLHPERDLSRNPLFQVMFVLQNTPSRNLELEGLKIETKTTKFDLTLSLAEELRVWLSEAQGALLRHI